MKRNIAIAAVTAAVLVGGGIAATAAFADDDSSAKDRTTRSAERTTDDGPADRGATDGRVSLEQAVAAALKAVPGTVTEAELDDEDDDDNGPAVWELDVYGSDKVWHDVTVHASSGKVLSTRDDDDNDDRDRHAPRSASVSLKSATDAALGSVPGAVTSVDLDDDDDDDDREGGAARWDVEVAGKDGKSHELHVDAKTGKVTADRDDDGDDRDDRDDNRDDDRDDRAGDDGRGDDDGDDS